MIQVMDTIKEQELRELKAQLSGYCSDKGISKADLAVKAQVSGATLSAIENEQWKKISVAMVKKLQSFLNAESSGEIYETSDFVSIVHLCDTARQHRLMIGLVGDTGTGKTTSLKHYSLRQNTYRVTFEKSMNPKQFFSYLLKELGVDSSGNINAMISKIADELNCKQSPLVIIDEAGKITHPVLLYLHDLREKTKGNCGIVLAGMPYFRENLKKYAQKGKEGYSEFLRRVNLWHTLSGLSVKETHFVAQANGITDPVELRDLSFKKRFGDLMNEICLKKIINSKLN